MGQHRVSRRSVLAAAAGAALAMENPVSAEAVRDGRIKQSVCKWCYPKMSVDDLCQQAKSMGILSVELLTENDWAIPAKYGLTCAMASGLTSIGDGWNRLENHDRFVRDAERLIPLARAAGLPTLICFSGNRRGMSDAEGLENCAKGLKRIMPTAEKEGINIMMELLNSKVDHKDYMCDRTPWGVELCRKVGSERFKLLYDIYHMQIMEGDVVRTIRDYKQYIGHFHTGGVPGRNEIDDTQELNYRMVSTAIAEMGFPGYFAHEFIPKRDPMTSLKQAVQLCTV